MNLKLRVWLPPDGDNRLVRFQEAGAAQTGRPEWAGVPPYLDLGFPARRPVGTIQTGLWQWDKGVPVLAALDSEGPLGLFRFGLPPQTPWTESELALLPPPPQFSWTRGRLADLDLEYPHDDGRFALWSWENPCGWRSDPPKA